MSTTTEHTINDLEKGTGGVQSDVVVDLSRVGTVVLTPELFEKLYLTPQTPVKGQLRNTFGNPTPLAVIGFVLSLTPLSCSLLGWMDSDGTGAAFLGVFVFVGGLLMILGGFMEFFIGNTYPFVVFCSMGSFFLALAATNIPSFGVMAAFTTPDMPGPQNPAFYNTFAFFIVFVGFMDFIYLIASIRTNICLLGILLFTVIGLELLAAAYWNIGAGNMEMALKFQHGAGGCTFVVCIFAWYLFLVLVLASVDFPISLPVGDLSTVVKGGSEKKKREA
ncbi:Similar to Protein alcS; acc. no. Q24JP1 [Pyronema omphalodes CBS 100304]|uniref:Similar to Protein alcS acc. no. Q24JP1 n=1 Tax=Pyronema omphalodes (strain CBS 100304) TaxID=1076935 RepID=U4LGQ2_PYROM|nr:Similar to Protein alcS; acc. no. Q24JP1 [Pyronema omphalodes CBS 100304]